MRLGDQGCGVFVVAFVRHLVQHPAEPRDMVVEGRIGPVRCDSAVTCADVKPHEQAQEPVDAFAHHDIVDADAVMLRKGRAQIVAFGVAVHPDLGRCLLHGGNGAGRGAKSAFVGPKPRGEGLSARAFLRLWSDEGDRGGERGSKRGQAGMGHDLTLMRSARGVFVEKRSWGP